MLKKLLILNINSECYSNINTSIIKRKVYSIKQFFVKNILKFRVATKPGILEKPGI